MAKLPVDKQAQALIRLLKEAERQLELSIERAIASGAIGTEANRRRQLALVRQFLIDVQNKAVGPAAELIVEAYRQGLVIADGEFKGSFNSIHQEAVNVLVQNLVSRINDSLATVGRKVEDVFRRETLRESTLGLIESGTRRQATERLKEQLIKEGKTAFVDSAGRTWNLDRYVRMAIRTTTAEAVNQATLSRFAETGVDLVTITKVSLTCDICRPYEGNTYSLSGAKGYERLTEFPPFHPNCRHKLIAATENAETFASRVAKASSLTELEEALSG